MSDAAKTQGELERTFRDVTDPGYHLPLEEDPLSWDPIAAMATTAARASRAVHTNSQSFYLLPHSRQTGESASGARRAEAWHQVRRRGHAGQALFVPAGKRVEYFLRDSRGQPARLEAYELAEDVVFAAGEVGPVAVRVRAVRPGDQANLPIADRAALVAEGVRTVALSAYGGVSLTDTGNPDVFTAADVGRYLRLQGEAPRRVKAYSQDALGRGQVELEGDSITGTGPAVLLEWSELGVELEQLEAFSGGRHAMLDQIGLERDMPRGPGEGDEDFAYRISSLPDVITPAALERICARILSPLGISYALHEVRDPELRGFVLDLTPLDAGGMCSDSSWAGGVLLSDSASKRLFVVCIERAINVGYEGGLAFDSMSSGVNAYDVGSSSGDGRPTGYLNALRALLVDLNAARGGGTAFRVVERTAVEPYGLHAVTLEVGIAAGTPEYLAARDEALAALVQQLRPGERTSEVELAEAIAGQLLMRGLDATGVTVLVTGGDLVPGPLEVLNIAPLGGGGGS